MGYQVVAADELARAQLCRCQQGDSDDAYVILVEDGYEVAKPLAKSGLARRINLFNSAQIPATFGTKTVSAFQVLHSSQQELKTRLVRYERSFGPDTDQGLLLVGRPGTGKTHLLCGLLHYLTLEKGVGCRFVDFFRLTARIRHSYGDGATEQEQDILDPLVEVPVLAIDELGKGRSTAWEQGIVDQLISRRYNAGRIVLATTNYLPESMLAPADDGQGGHRRGERLEESLEERIGLRVFSRLAEMCDLERVEGPDYRLLKQSTPRSR